MDLTRLESGAHRYAVPMPKNPVTKDSIKKMIDVLTPMSPQTAEKFLQDLLRLADERRKGVEKAIGDAAKAGVRTAEGLASTVQQELSRQVSRMAARVDDLERRVDSLSSTLEATRSNIVTLASRPFAKAEEQVAAVVETSKKKRKRSKTEKKNKKSGSGLDGVSTSGDSTPSTS